MMFYLITSNRMRLQQQFKRLIDQSLKSIENALDVTVGGSSKCYGDYTSVIG
jgi:hypothetical protein